MTEQALKKIEQDVYRMIHSNAMAEGDILRELAISYARFGYHLCEQELHPEIERLKQIIAEHDKITQEAIDYVSWKPSPNK